MVKRVGAVNSPSKLSGRYTPAPLPPATLLKRQYLTITLPKLAFSPHDHHWKALKRVLQLVPFIMAFSFVPMFDSYWGCDLEDRKSTSGFYVYLGLNIVSWSSHKQKVVFRSSKEAEYRSIIAALADIKWITSHPSSCAIASGRYSY
ncbi:hypothetical protein V8G54_003006 [Vigna mungo]|uniref:Mitochondrial protein n=1 Tax=Vigna mungo TaxID=3915 RepID=A0AAQ3PBB0_VIGMU